MSINTKRVTGRRTVRYDSLDDLLRDARQLASGQVRSLGNWSLGQCLHHVAGAIDMGIEGTPSRAPLPLRLVGRLFKGKFLRGPLTPGFKIPKFAAGIVAPGSSTDTQAGLQSLQKSISRWRSDARRAAHPILGRLTPDEWEQFECRHAELHMSFQLPA